MDDLSTIADRVQDDTFWQESDDPGGVYAAIIAIAVEASAAAQRETPDAVDFYRGGWSSSVMSKLAEIARELGERLRVAARGLNASSCSVTVAGFPPSIQASISWDVPR